MTRRTQAKTLDKREPELGEAELEVLKALWELGSATVRQVMDKLHERGKKVAYTTVLTFLTRLETKGFVASNKDGLAYVYKAQVSRRKIAKARLRSLMDQLFDGAPGEMVLQLMEGETLSPDELAQLRALLERLDTRTE